jgi:hypothetical protein
MAPWLTKLWMKPAIKYSIITLGVLTLLAPVLYFCAVIAVLKSHAKEDRIVFGSKLIQQAINDYIEKHDSPPLKLETLVPEFIASIPSFPEISKVDYHLSADGKQWTLDLYWTNRKIPLIYRRTNAGLSSEDAMRRIDTENGCYVLKAH